MSTHLRCCFGIILLFSAHLTLFAQTTPPLRILPVGDSITFGGGGLANYGGYRKPLYDVLTVLGYNVDYLGTQNTNGAAIPDPDHQGQTGWRIDQITSNIEGWLGTFADPDIILLHIGANDFLLNYDTPNAINRLDLLIAKIATLRPHARIIVTSLLQSAVTNQPPGTPDPIDEKVRTEFNPFLPSRIAAHASLGRKVSFLDMRAVLTLADLVDKLHPNQTGYNKIAAAWLNAIQTFANPHGDTIPPKVAKAQADSSGQSLTITFSKPVADTAANLANYTLSHNIPLTPSGPTPSTISLSSDKRTITITPSPDNTVFEPGTPYTVTINSITDRRTPPLPIAANTTATFLCATPSGYASNIPESETYTLIHSIDLPIAPLYTGTTPAPYQVDNRSTVGAFDRIAYYLELQRTNGDIQYVWTSMDAFTTDINKVGIPTQASGAIFEQLVTNLHVKSNVPGVLNTNVIAGNIEFWPQNYTASTNNNLGGNPTTFDFDDTRSTAGSYGSMQVHNTLDRKTVLAVNNWGTGTPIDVGIGNNPTPTSGGIDWVLANNGGNYTLRRLQVLVQSQNDTTPPTLLSATATPGRNRIYVKFSEPIAPSSIHPNQFFLSHGVTILDLTLAENQTDLILTTTLQPPATPLVLLVNGVHDSSPNANPIALNSIITVTPATLPPEILTHIGPAASNYELVYSIELPTVGNLRSLGHKAYQFDDSAATSSFNRIAYYLEVQRPNYPPYYIWVSMDAFTGDRRKLGIPTPESGAIHQRNVANMDVISNFPGVVNAQNIPTGNLEFWPSDYSVANAQNIPNASATLFDFGDTRLPTGSFGSMQIHNPSASQTLFAINHWGSDGNLLDIGIGNHPAPTGNIGADWSNAANAAQLSRKILHVLVLPGNHPLPPGPVATNIGPEAQGYQLAYSLDIPDGGQLTSPSYSINNSTQLGPFKRIAYYMQLQTGAANPEYVWASMDAFTTDPAKIAIPTPSSGAVHQRILTNMNVISNRPGVANGTNIPTGNIEFWPTGYYATNALNIPNSNNTHLDFGDQIGPGNHGSMQIHNHGLPVPHTLFSITNWGNPAAPATNRFGMGIGSNPRPTYNGLDWTFAANSHLYSSRLLQVWVLPGEGDTTGPTLVHALGSTTLSRLILTFSEPIANTTVLPTNFTIPGLTITSATLLPNKKEVVLTTTPHTPGATYTVTASNLLDLSSNANLSPIGTSATFTAYTPSSLLSSIPEADGYDLIYQLAIPATTPFWNINNIPYSIDETRYGDRPYQRVAYLMQLDTQWVFVSFDAHTTQITKIGVPTAKVTTAPFQQQVTNMTVAKSSTVTNITPGSYPTGGNIEFWSGNYLPANALNIPNSNITTYDQGDTMIAGVYGCMQIHHHAVNQTLFAFNNWGNYPSTTSDVGIGNSPLSNTDWTLAANADRYTVRNLYILVKSEIPTLARTASLTTETTSETTSSSPQLASLTTTTETTPNPLTTIITNTAPTFHGYRFTIAKDTPAQISTTRLLTKATDAENDPLTTVTISPTSSAGGSATLKNNTLNYTPPPGYLGPDSLTLTIADPHIAQTPGPIHITIVPALPPPGANSIITTRSDGKIDTVFRGQPGQLYQIQRSQTLLPDSWQNLTTTPAGDDGLIPLHDSTPPPDHGFYRAVPLE